ncbi:ankyrin repeat-containing domain protein [Xylaria arbuscula]|nr:ankyrin repeat-containing domain protein [Xylaria arbuscula]
MSSYEGLTILAPDKEDDLKNCIIDIVAVPGLGANPKASFGSEEKNPFNWLSDSNSGIRSDIPGARVLLFNYDSRVWGRQAIQQTLFNAATSLLDVLVERREEDDTRPLVFLAHSMGGLVVAKALALAKDRPELIDKVRIYECFAGAIFFGTPFGGSKSANKGIMLAEYLEKVNFAKNNQMLQFLDPERDSLQELRNRFSQIAVQEPKATITCIYELKGLIFGPKLIGQSEIIVDKQSATLDFADSYGMECDHRQLNRFNRTNDARYDVVRRKLREIVQKADRIVKRRLKDSKQSLVDDDTFVRLSDNLNLVDFRGIRKKVEGGSGDSSWILQEPSYKKWMAQTRNLDRFILVSGVEGRGKGKAAFLAVEQLEELEKNSKQPGAEDILVAYFSCDSLVDSCRAENMVRSLIWQLILKRRNLGQYVKGLATQAKSGNIKGVQDSISLSRLWIALRQMLRDPSVSTVYFVLNNLHELPQEDENTTKFFQLLNDEVLAPLTTDSVDDEMGKSRWMFLSRSQDYIKEVLLGKERSNVLWVNLEDGSRNSVLLLSLRSYIRNRVRQLAATKSYSLALQFFVESILAKRATSPLWVEVVCRLLEGIPANHIRVRKMVEALPQSLDDLISHSWRESLTMKTDGIDTSKEILRTLAIAYEDPSLDELKILADLELKDDESEVDQLCKLVRACGPLLRIYSPHEWDEESGSQRVTFIHPMAKDALLTQATSRKLLGLSENDDDKTDVKWQHGILALRCFGYVLEQLNSDDDSFQWIHSLESVEGKSSEEKDKEILNQIFPEKPEEDLQALNYPVKYWLQHGNDSTDEFVKTLDLSHPFWSLESSARNRWWSSYTKVAEFDDLKNLTPMHVAAYFGLTPLIEQLVQPSGNRDQIHQHDSWQFQPLHWASFQGHETAMNKLLEMGAAVNDRTVRDIKTPLHMAAGNGHIKAMELLLQRGASIDAVDLSYGTPLTFALSWNREDAANLLLSHGASSTLTSHDFDSPVAAAALKGFQKLVIRLLDAGGAYNLVSKEYGSALAAAASAGHSDIVNILLSVVPVDRTMEWCQRAVLEAAKNGHPLIARSILLKVHFLNIDDAFEAAASLGQMAVLEELWGYNQANGTLSSKSLNTALYDAVDNEHDSVVSFLLRDCGASANATGEEYGNAVTASAFDGTVDILKMLIAAGANLSDPAGWPLEAAASQGMKEAVQQLLQHKAAINAVSKKSPNGTALQAAVVSGHIEIAKMLLDYGADANLGGGVFTNPITAAVSCRHSALLKLLLEARANPNVTGGSDNSTPLINAALYLPVEDLEVLIRFGAKVDTYDEEEDTALIISAHVGDDACVKSLLDHRANVNFCGKQRGTALHAAAAQGFVKTCDLLLSRGADPTIRGGPLDTVLQAACSGGQKEIVQMALCAPSIPKLSLRRNLRNYRHRINVDAHSADSEHSTALHAAAVAHDDACLRMLLKRKPALDVVDKKGMTALQVACLAGCNRNARLLLTAGANPNMAGGSHGSALQAAALRGSPALVELLLEKGARTNEWRGKYFNPLVAAVVKCSHAWEGLTTLETLLAKPFPVRSYQAALERAFMLGEKEAFEKIWKSAVEKGPKALPNMGLKELLEYYMAIAQQPKKVEENNVFQELESENEDFPWDFYSASQEIEDDVVVYEAAKGSLDGDAGGASAGRRGFNNQGATQGDAGGGPGTGNPNQRDLNLPVELGADGDEPSRGVGVGADDWDDADGADGEDDADDLQTTSQQTDDPEAIVDDVSGNYTGINGDQMNDGTPALVRSQASGDYQDLSDGGNPDVNQEPNDDRGLQDDEEGAASMENEDNATPQQAQLEMDRGIANEPEPEPEQEEEVEKEEDQDQEDEEEEEEDGPEPEGYNELAPPAEESVPEENNNNNYFTGYQDNSDDNGANDDGGDNDAAALIEATVKASRKLKGMFRSVFD